VHDSVRSNCLCRISASVLCDYRVSYQRISPIVAFKFYAAIYTGDSRQLLHLDNSPKNVLSSRVRVMLYPLSIRNHERPAEATDYVLDMSCSIEA
jgi:hypothetical protein